VFEIDDDDEFHLNEKFFILNSKIKILPVKNCIVAGEINGGWRRTSITWNSHVSGKWFNERNCDRSSLEKQIHSIKKFFISKKQTSVIKKLSIASTRTWSSSGHCW